MLPVGRRRRRRRQRRRRRRAHGLKKVGSAAGWCSLCGAVGEGFGHAAGSVSAAPQAWGINESKAFKGERERRLIETQTASVRLTGTQSESLLSAVGATNSRNEEEILSRQP